MKIKIVLLLSVLAGLIAPLAYSSPSLTDALVYQRVRYENVAFTWDTISPEHAAYLRGKAQGFKETLDLIQPPVATILPPSQVVDTTGDFTFTFGTISPLRTTVNLYALRWTASPDAAYYEIVADTGLPFNIIWRTKGNETEFAYLNIVMIRGFIGETWKVRAVGVAGEVSDWVGAETLIVIAPPVAPSAPRRMSEAEKDAMMAALLLGGVVK